MPKAWRWNGGRVKLIDGTTVSMSDTAENQGDFPQNSEQKPGLGFPVARISGRISLVSGAVIRHAGAACEGKGSGERTLLRGLLPLFASGDVLLADALLTTWWIIADAHAAGVDVVMPQHARRITDFSPPTGPLGSCRDMATPQTAGLDDPRHLQSYPVELSMCEVDGRVLVNHVARPTRRLSV